jgi:hypothetical protein
MSLLATLIQGDRIALDLIKPSAKLAHDADMFAHHPIGLDAGSTEASWIGSWLVHLAAQGSSWHGVPWRLLRNDYMRYNPLKRVLVKDEKRVPDFRGKSAPEIQAHFGKGPLVTLLIGVKKLVEAGLIEVITLEDEDYLLPTDALLERSPSVFRESVSPN